MHTTDSFAASLGPPLAARDSVEPDRSGRPSAPDCEVLQHGEPRITNQGEREQRLPSKRRVTITSLVLTLAIPLLLLLMHRIDRQMLERINQTLTKTAGVPVRIGSISATLAPGVALHDVSLGTTLSVQRIDVTFARDGWRPRIRTLRLIRPRIDVTAPALASTLSPNAKRATRSLDRTAARLPRWRGILARLNAAKIFVHDGTLKLDKRAFGQHVELRARGIFVTPIGDRYRIVTGNVSTALQGTLGRYDLDLAALAVDVDAKGTKLVRGAFLAGKLSLGPAPNGPPVARLQLLQGRLTRSSDAFLLDIQARPQPQQPPDVAGRRRQPPRSCVACEKAQSAPTLMARVTLGHPGTHRSSDRPGPGVQLTKVELAFKRHPLGALQALFDRERLRDLEGLASGFVSFAREDRSRLAISGELSVSALAMRARALAPRRLRFAPLSLRLLGSLTQDTARIEQLSVKSGKLTLHGQLTYKLAPRRIQLSLSMPQIHCQDILTALPDGFVPKLDGLVTSGSIGARGQLDVSWPADETRDIASLTFAPLTCRVVRDPELADVHRLVRGQRVSLDGYDAKGRKRMFALDARDPKYYPLIRIPRKVRDAFVGAEDARFYSHDGFARAQIARALLHNLHVGRFSRGASTISQQVVKNLLLNQRRDLSRKFQEAVLTWRMEHVLPKGRILELYLNLVEMAPGVYGVGRAAQRLFGKRLGRLNPLQVAHLAALTPSPRRFFRTFEHHPPGPAWHAKLRKLLHVMAKRGAITKTEAARWAKAPLKLNHQPRLQPVDRN